MLSSKVPDGASKAFKRLTELQLIPHSVCAKPTIHPGLGVASRNTNIRRRRGRRISRVLRAGLLGAHRRRRSVGGTLVMGWRWTCWGTCVWWSSSRDEHSRCQVAPSSTSCPDKRRCARGSKGNGRSVLASIILFSGSVLITNTPSDPSQLPDCHTQRLNSPSE